MNKKHKVNLSDDQRVQLLDLVKKGKEKGAREIRRAHTLLMADSGSTDEAIARTLRFLLLMKVYQDVGVQITLVPNLLHKIVGES